MSHSLSAPLLPPLFRQCLKNLCFGLAWLPKAISDDLVYFIRCEVFQNTRNENPVAGESQSPDPSIFLTLQTCLTLYLS